MHDPPGGSSSSSFTNSQLFTTFTHEDKTVESGDATEGEYNLGMDGTWGMSTTATIGIGAAVSFKNPELQIAASFQHRFSSSFGYGWGDIDDEDGEITDQMEELVQSKKNKADGEDRKPSAFSKLENEVTTDITYATSLEPEMAGPMADMCVARVRTMLNTTPTSFACLCCSRGCALAHA